MVVPKRKPTRDMMSVYPPRHVAVPLGGYKTKRLSAGIRIAAHLLSEAALEVAHEFPSRKEWDFLYESLQGRAIEPEMGRPGYYMAEAVEQRHARFGSGAALDGKSADKSVAAFANKLRDLTYLQAWAAIIACTWREEHDHETAEEGWWTLAYREKREVSGDGQD